MVFLSVVLGIVVAYFLIRAWVWFVNMIFSLFKKKKKANMDNPYIHFHLMRRVNDADYEEYLKWLDEDGGGLPIEKVKTLEEVRFEDKIKRASEKF